MLEEAADLQRLGFREGSAEDREVLREQRDPPAIDQAEPGDDPVPRIPLLVETETGVPMHDVRRRSPETNRGSSSRSMRSRAVSLPRACCASMRSCPPPR